MKNPDPQVLLIDADDTLWENNVYFEQSIADFMAFLNHQEMTHEEVRLVINQVEHETILERGYGYHSFAHSLVRTFERLSSEPVTPDRHEVIWNFAHRISQYPIELIAGVPETLAYLCERRHNLILMTKGDFTEQSSKVERSGLQEYFSAVEIVAEKNAPTYRSIMAKYELTGDLTWMVGNSPKSDINPAREAGWNAVFVPHAHTWALERQEIEPRPGHLLVVERFSDLTRHF
ncbi:MAG: HAD family hydrolase [Acidobacteriia bacterium]|nr:HAD family hydrolase [Terriglobia bacterium]